MSERPILFSAPMVRAILEGRKTQTRRIVNPQPGAFIMVMEWLYANVWKGRHWEGSWNCPYGQPGDRLWVRELTRFDPDQGWRYDADGGDVADDNFAYSRPVCPSIHMPRSASRITLEIIRVRCERLQQISGKDVIAEGAVLRAHDDQFGHNPVSAFDGCVYLDLKSLWAAGWDKINGKRAPCASNPWVWVIEFKRRAP